MHFNHDLDLIIQPWFHGILSRDKAIPMLKLEGDFIVRVSMIRNKLQVVLTLQLKLFIYIIQESSSISKSENSKLTDTNYVISVRYSDLEKFYHYIVVQDNEVRYSIMLYQYE